MSALPLADLLPRVVALADAAGRAILATPRRPGDEVLKGDGSPVTAADHAAHAVIAAGLRALEPGVPMLSEEGRHLPYEARAAWETFWLVDPLDGTKEYLRGDPDYTVNIALVQGGVPVLGVVHAPARAVTYTGASGLGSTRAAGGVSTGLVAGPPPPGRPVRIAESRSHPSPGIAAFLAPYRAIERVAIGSSLKFCLVADGSADAYVRLGPTMEWDVAAGDAVFRWATAGAANPSPLVYNTPTLRNAAFVIGFLPPPPGVLLVAGHDADATAAVATALARAGRAHGATVSRMDRAADEPPAAFAARLAEAEASGATVVTRIGDAGPDLAAAACARSRLVVRVAVGAEQAPPAGGRALPVDPDVETPDAAAARVMRWLTGPERLGPSREA